MAIDPRNYDVSELRSAGTGEPPARRETRMADAEAESEAKSDREPSPAAATTAFRDSVTRDLAAMEQGTGNLTRPYLTALPGSLVAEALVFEWLEFLVLQAGEESVADALAFYERVGWLGNDAADALNEYLWGITEPQANEANDLDPDDHRVSLHYVARLAAISRD